MKSPRHWALDAILGLDCWLNTMLAGEPGITISSRAAKARDAGKWWGRALCRFLHWLDADHCDEAVANDLQRSKDNTKYEET